MSFDNGLITFLKLFVQWKKLRLKNFVGKTFRERFNLYSVSLAYCINPKLTETLPTFFHMPGTETLSMLTLSSGFNHSLVLFYTTSLLRRIDRNNNKNVRYLLARKKN